MAASNDSVAESGDDAAGTSNDDAAAERSDDPAPHQNGDGESRGRPCPMCGEQMYHRHCKYVCPQHGVVYDCADTFY